MNSSPITRNSVMRHMRRPADMASQSFDVGVLRSDKSMLLREGVTAEQMDWAS